MKQTKHFNMIEAMVVTLVVGIVTSIVYGMVGQTKDLSENFNCKSNIK